jgi:hypothetical protein
MAESSATLGWADLKSEVGHFLGYGRTVANFSADQLADVEASVKAGIRMFYQPPVLPGEMAPYDWSFLHINTTIATVANDAEQDLPDAFGGVDGDFTFATTDSAFHAVPIIGEGQIRAMQQGNTQTGVPQYAAVRVKSSTMTTGQRFEVCWWPKPDAIYTMGFRFRVQQDMISTSYPYPLGGSAHTETILSACIAMADERINDQPKGARWEAFMDRLRASVSYDRKRGQEYFGYNGDQSDNRVLGHRRFTNNVTYNSVEYP